MWMWIRGSFAPLLTSAFFPFCFSFSLKPAQPLTSVGSCSSLPPFRISISMENTWRRHAPANCLPVCCSTRPWRTVSSSSRYLIAQVGGSFSLVRRAQMSPAARFWNHNNNGYLERLTLTGPKHLHILWIIIIIMGTYRAPNPHRP